MYFVALAVLFLVHGATTTDPTPTAASTLGTLYRQARSDQYYMSRYGSDNTPLSSDPASVRTDPVEHRDAAYFESRCITCDPNKSAVADQGHQYRSRGRPGVRNDWIPDELEDRRYREVYNDYNRERAPGYDYDRYDRYGRYDLLRPLYYYGDRYDRDRDQYRDRDYDRYYDRGIGYDRGGGIGYDRGGGIGYDRGGGIYDRLSGSYDRGNGYDNLDSRYPYEGRYETRYSPYRRPYDDPYTSPTRYDKYYNRNNNALYGGSRYDRYDPYDRVYSNRRPYDDRYDRYEKYGGRGYDGADGRGYYASGTWGPGYDRGYASGYNYGGARDQWRDRDIGRDRDPGPRDYFYDSTASPHGNRWTSYLHDRPESSTKPNQEQQDKPTTSSQLQDNKVYKD